MKARGCGLIVVGLLAGCIAAPVVVEKREAPAPAVVKPVEEAFREPAVPERTPRSVEDRDLLLEGVRLINLPERPELPKARSLFISLIRFHPQSRWRPAAEAFIRLIDDREQSREENLQGHLQTDRARAEKAAVTQENESLRKTVRELTERLQAETAALAQENEKLKQDIQRLKALEIELEKREKRLR
jgi:hypothetical protein